MKKILTSLLLLGCILCFTACGKDSPVPTTTEPAISTEAPTDAPETQPPIPGYDQQANLIWENREHWQMESYSEYERYWYTFTDLDHNGRMEVLGAITQGTGIFTWGKIWEVSEDFTALEEVYSSDDLPELILSSMVCYEDPISGHYHYCCSNSTHISAREYGTVHLWVSLDHGQWREIELASLYQTYEPNREEYTGPNGPITEEEFESAFAHAGTGMNRRDVYFNWIKDGEITGPEEIRNSFSVFMGQRRNLREVHSDLYMYIEGIPESVPSTLFVGQDYSIYLPDDIWTYAGILDSGIPTDTWTPIYNEEVQLRIIRLEGMDPDAAQEWAKTQFPEYDMIPDKLGGLGGMDASWTHIIDIRLHAIDESCYALISLYPAEAAEGFGVRLQAICDTFLLG